MSESFGARLKAQRERQQVTLETIAARTKIRLALFEDLERDDVSRWPGGLFRRSYFRSYSAAIGLDPETAVREFLDLYPEPAEEAPAETPDESGQTSGAPKTRLHYLLASALEAVSKPFDRERPDRVAPEVAPEAVRSDQAFVNPTASAGDETGRAGVHVDLDALAQLCTRIAEAGNSSALEALLGEAARILDVAGIIVWPWDPARGSLVPSLSHGYPSRTLARLPAVSPDDDNPVGAAFRTSTRQVVAGGGSATSAIVVPLTTMRGCVGVLAIEFANGLEQDRSVQAVATVLAAQLSLALQHVQADPASQHAIA